LLRLHIVLVLAVAVTGAFADDINLLASGVTAPSYEIPCVVVVTGPSSTLMLVSAFLLIA